MLVGVFLFIAGYLLARYQYDMPTTIAVNEFITNVLTVFKKDK